MTVIDQILNEWSFRCHDGIVDMNDPKKVKILFEILKPILTEDIDDDILNALIDADSDTKSQVLNFIKKSTSKTVEKSSDGGFYAYLKSKNITDDMIDGVNVPERIHDLLIDNNDFDNFNKYRKTPKSFPGGSNSLPEILAGTGVSPKSISEIINIDGKKKGAGVGKGEVALALFFSDIRKAPGKGDLDWNGDNLEVKSIGARFGGEREVNSSVILGSKLGKAAEQYDFNPLKRLDAVISGLHDEMDPKELYDIVVDFFKNIYPNADFNYLSIDSLKNITDTRKALNKLYISNYMNSENIQHIIFINSAGNYIAFTPEQIEDIVDKNIIKINSISGTNLYPQIK
jgi:hypothetical protein